MCQLNVFCVSENIARDKVLALMKEHLGFGNAECIDDENPVPALKGKFGFFISGGMRCNCGSVVSLLSDGDCGSFEQFVTDNVRRNVERLVAVKEIMSRRGYRAKKKSFQREYDRLVAENEAMFGKVAELETKLTERIMNDESLSEEEKARRLHSDVYPLVEQLNREIDDSEAMREFRERFEKFMNSDDNDLLRDSCAYTLKKRKPGKMTLIPLCGDESEETEITLPSDNIDDVIENAKRDARSQTLREEYAEIAAFVGAVTALRGQVKLFSFRQENGKPEITGETAVNVAEMTIDDIAGLPYNVLMSFEI